MPKLVYMLAYAKATAAELLEIEQSFSLMLRHPLSCDASFPWDVLTGAMEQDDLGAVRLATESLYQVLWNNTGRSRGWRGCERGR